LTQEPVDPQLIDKGQVALYEGGEREHRRLLERFAFIRDNVVRRSPDSSLVSACTFGLLGERFTSPVNR